MACRCIVHLDLDAFYAQVERKRLGLPLDTPVGVDQVSPLLTCHCPQASGAVHMCPCISEEPATPAVCAAPSRFRLLEILQISPDRHPILT